MKLEEAHEWEDYLRELIKKKYPCHPVLKFYGSTWQAIDAYEKVYEKIIREEG